MTTIEWTRNRDGSPGKTWNPVSGCTKISPGCKNCYAEKMAKRLGGRFGYPADEPFRVTLHPDKLTEPLTWRKPTTIFVCSMADLFHKDVPDEFIAAVFAVMALAPQHTYQVLTKRPERMASWFAETGKDPGSILADAAGQFSVCNDEAQCAIANYINGWSRWRHMPDDGNPLNGTAPRWPLPNVWAGTSVENQEYADRRIPHLLQTPAAVRFLSCEPLLGPVDLRKYGWLYGCDACCNGDRCPGPPECTRYSRPECPVCKGTARGRNIDWVIVGGESGPGARSMHPDWARSLRDQCQAAGVSFFFKQWGAWVPGIHPDYPHTVVGNDDMMRLSKKEAGRELDGRTWDEMPAKGAG